jgi:hypothetical protein
MATLITGTTQQVEFRNTNPKGALPFGELAQVYEIDPTMNFPIQPPSWVMALAQLTALVTANVVTVE